eukprot:9930081-Prorocentrum_lima.AAC.1
MTSSLVGSEMCIRDRVSRVAIGVIVVVALAVAVAAVAAIAVVAAVSRVCLLYTSDAADDM